MTLTTALLTAGAAGLGAGLGPLLDRAVDRFPRHAAPTTDNTAQTAALVVVGHAGPDLPAAPTCDGAPTSAPSDDTRPGCTHECRRPLRHRRQVLTFLTAGTFAALAARVGLRWELLPALTLAAAVLPLAFCDLEHLLLPKRLVRIGVAAVAGSLVVCAAGTGSWHRLVVAAACAGASGAGLAVISFANPRWVAWGDTRLAFLIGLGLGWLGVPAVVLSILVANVSLGLGGLAVVISGRRHSIRALPFGVFLALGAIVSLFLHA